MTGLAGAASWPAEAEQPVLRARSGGEESCVVRLGRVESAADGLSAVEAEGVRLAGWKGEAVEGRAREGVAPRGGWVEDEEVCGRRMSHSCCLSGKENDF